MSECAAEAPSCGEEMMGERQEDKLLEKIQYGGTAIRCNHSPKAYPGRIRRGLLSTKSHRPSLAQRCIQPVMES